MSCTKWLQYVRSFENRISVPLTEAVLVGNKADLYEEVCLSNSILYILYIYSNELIRHYFVTHLTKSTEYSHTFICNLSLNV